MVLTTRGAITTAAVTAGISACLLIVSVAHAATTTGPNTANEPATAPVVEAGYPIENYLHPNADEIAATTGVVLKEGDGYLMFADCTNNREQIQVVRSGTARRTLCFNLTGPTGWLTMEIPASYGVRAGKNHDLTVTTTDNGHTETRTVTKGARQDVSNAIGEDVVLVELRIK